MRVRAARAEDLPGVLALLEGAGLPSSGVDLSLLDGLAVACTSDTLVGCGAVEPLGRTGLLRSVAVDPGWSRRGLGTRIVGDRLAWAGAKPLEAIYLLTTTASGFFERLGFVVVDRRALPAEVHATREATHLCPQTAVAMIARLSSTT